MEAAASPADDLVPAFKALDAFVDRLDFVVDPAELGDAVCEVVALRSKIEATLSRVVDAAGRTGVAQASGQRTVGQFVAARTNTTSMPINQAARLAVWLRDFPLFTAAFGVSMTADHLHYLRKLDTTYTKHLKLIADQQIFVDAAADCSFTGFQKACDYWALRIDPDGKEPKDQIESTRLSIRRGSGARGLIQGECDALTRQILTTAIDHQANKIRIADKEAGIVRTEGQRRMAALTTLVARGHARQDGSFPVPLVNLVMSLNVAEWAHNTLTGQTNNSDHDVDSDSGCDSVPVDAFDVDGRCELIDGTPIHPFLALFAFNNIGCDLFGAPNLRRYVMQADSRVIDVSVNARYFPEWMRTTAFVESRGECTTHGCDVPHSWLQIDHVDPVANGGQTRLDNAQPQCPPDNHAKAATTGTIPWRDRPLPPRHHRFNRTQKLPPPNDDDPDDQPHS